MIKLPEKIRRTLEKIVKEMRIKENVYSVGLFASWSRGDATKSSDVDLLVLDKGDFNHEFVERIEINGLLVDLDHIPKAWIHGQIPPELDQKINEMQTSESLIVQMKPILDKIKEKFNNFSDNEDKNQLQAIQWCSRHKLIQQGFTLLQEFIVSYICRKNSYNVSKLKDREFISTCLSVKGRDIPEQQWNEHLKKQKEKAEKIIEQLNKEVAEIYINIGQYRNDLNHAGCVQPHDFEKFVIELENFVSKVSSLINRER